MEVQDIAVEVALPVQRQHLLDDGQRDALGRRLLAAPVKQAIIADALVPPFPPPHLPVRDPEDLSGLIPLQASINGS
jgi:hypothetical protein